MILKLLLSSVKLVNSVRYQDGLEVYGPPSPQGYHKLSTARLDKPIEF